MGSARTACLYAALALFSAAHAIPHETRFSNGLRLIVKEDHRKSAGEFSRRVDPAVFAIVTAGAAQ
jgi:hypothetical protein